MITRPLDLSSRLKRAPRGFDTLFYVNTGLLVVFFLLFGSRFVLSPGLGVDFQVPVMPGALEAASPTDVVVAIKGADMAFVEGAKVNFAGLRQYLTTRAQGREGLRLLVQADSALTTRDLTDVYEMARAAGFVSMQIAAEPAQPR